MDANCRFLFGHLVCWLLLVEIGKKIIEAVQAIKQIVTQMKQVWGMMTLRMARFCLGLIDVVLWMKRKQGDKTNCPPVFVLRCFLIFACLILFRSVTLNYRFFPLACPSCVFLSCFVWSCCTATVAILYQHDQGYATYLGASLCWTVQGNEAVQPRCWT